MIEIDFINCTYTCPFCCKEQTYSTNNMDSITTGYNISYTNRDLINMQSDVKIYHIECSNKACRKITVVGYNADNHKQWDLIPENVYKHYPEYIPQQIRDDYREACLIIDNSPKAAATLLRRCLQGMIHDFWNVHEKNLNAEITTLKSKVSSSQWKAIDGLRSIGNIGAHMEQDVNVVIDIEIPEAQKLKRLIETLLEKWYITRHDEEELFDSIVDVAEKKEEKRKIDERNER